MAEFFGAARDKSVVEVFLRDKERFQPWVGYLEALMDDQRGLSRAEKEMVALRVSALNGCHYCTRSHHAVLVAHGLTPEEASEIEAGVVSDARIGALLGFVGKLTTTPAGVVANDAKAMTEAGWSDQAIEDAIQVAAAFAFMNRLVDGYGVHGSEKVFAMIAPVMAKSGYGSIKSFFGG